MPKSLTPTLQGRRVIVIGGGLAGLAAARDLIARGAEVQVLEAFIAQHYIGVPIPPALITSEPVSKELIGALIEQSGVPAVPAYIEGAFEAMPRWAKRPRRHPIRVLFGRPIDAATLAAGTGGTPAARIIAALRAAVIALVPGEH